MLATRSAARIASGPCWSVIGAAGVARPDMGVLAGAVGRSPFGLGAGGGGGRPVRRPWGRIARAVVSMRPRSGRSAWEGLGPCAWFARRGRGRQ